MCQSNHNRWSLALRHASDREAILVLLWLNEIEIEHLCQVCQHDLEVAFSEGLPEAHPFASTPRQPTHSVSFLARRCQVQGILRIETIG